MSTTNFWLIRHGETTWNANRRLQGWSDIPLSATGIRQAECLANWLRPPQFTQRIDLIAASDLSRAADTARIAAEHLGLPITLATELRERSYGIYEGEDWNMLNRADRGRAINLRDPDLKPEGGESLRDFQARIQHAFQSLADQHPGKNLMVFSHGGVIDMAWRLATGLALEVPRPHPILNTSINCFAIEADGQWRAGLWGQASHLDEMALDDAP